MVAHSRGPHFVSCMDVRMRALCSNFGHDLCKSGNIFFYAHSRFRIYILILIFGLFFFNHASSNYRISSDLSFVFFLPEKCFDVILKMNIRSALYLNCFEKKKKKEQNIENHRWNNLIESINQKKKQEI
jgi:hypothetical protein